ncbi:molybdate transport system ATP-binding protein [Plasticicumulans lactativorans]|uniref:Molybdate transport system ATP-binding protein n=1 Tax=Plasticicumulans lactativorans TaxID=1133106 RepID=A0A4V2SD92_9GAMM|nr:ATP-binding cassette domain-containing protein [Plasticicumulans lactativorans]TCO82450.1 molybdate transport system ATP-binding protein [Plasticicumulans lactativorans]
MTAVWDFELARCLRHDGRRFDLHVACRSEAARLVLFGPSGAGKSQTLQMIAGLARPDRGHVRVAGTTLFDRASGVDLSPQRRRLAYVFQDYALFPHLTVRQNVAFALHGGLRNPSRHAADASVDHWLATFQLQAVARHYPEQLSGGQRQRTALARALVARPRALLLDEPFAALDRALRRRLRDELAELQAELKLPLLLITHDEDDVHQLADAVVQLDGGRVVGTTVAPAAGALPQAGRPRHDTPREHA